jgi:hypothetical protein
MSERPSNTARTPPSAPPRAQSTWRLRQIARTRIAVSSGPPAFAIRVDRARVRLDPMSGFWSSPRAHPHQHHDGGNDRPPPTNRPRPRRSNHAQPPIGPEAPPWSLCGSSQAPAPKSMLRLGEDPGRSRTANGPDGGSRFPSRRWSKSGPLHGQARTALFPTSADHTGVTGKPEAPVRWPVFGAPAFASRRQRWCSTSIRSAAHAPSLCLCTERNASGQVALPWVVAKRAPRRHRTRTPAFMRERGAECRKRIPIRTDRLR